MPERTYSEDEVADLLRRAAERQAQAGSDSLARSQRPGLTLAELAAIAADAGLDPEHLRSAAAEMDGGAMRRRATSHVSPSEISAERWVPGRLSDVEKEDIIADLRHRFDTASSYDWGMGQSYGKSTVQMLGRSIEWQHIAPFTGQQHRVLIQPREDGVRIRVSRNNVFTGTATNWSPWYALMAAAAAWFITGPITGSFLLGGLVALAALIVSLPLLVKFSRAEAVKNREAVERFADEIASHVVPATPTVAREIAGESSARTLEIPSDEFRAEDRGVTGRLRER